jgi:hypothetical protein
MDREPAHRVIADWRRRDIIGAGAAMAVAVVPSARALASLGKISRHGETAMAENGKPLFGWNELIEGLRPLGDRLEARLPEHLRNDPRVVQESYRLLLSGLTRGISDAIVGDRRHPMFVPELNICQNIFQPNADTIYKTAMIDGAGSYRIHGERGGVRMFVLAQLGPDTIRTGQHSPALFQYDFDTLKLDKDGHFDVIVSQTRPEGHQGDWWELSPKAEKFMVRIVGCDWGDEREPRFGIDRLDVPPSKGRHGAADLSARLAELPAIAWNCAHMFTDHVDKLVQQGLLNQLKVVDFSNMTGLSRQSYYEGAYELADDEALISSVKVPREVGYWSLILTNEIFETTDWYNNQSSLNDAQAHLDHDGVFRAVISARDPGVPNWLDTAGYAKGAIQGRWFDTDERPTPTLIKVKLVDVRKSLPAETPHISPAEREASIRARRIKAQMRVIW